MLLKESTLDTGIHMAGTADGFDAAGSCRELCFFDDDCLSSRLSNMRRAALRLRYMRIKTGPPHSDAGRGVSE